MPTRHQFTPRKKDLVKLKKLNQSTRRKKRRLEKIYGVKHNIDIQDISSFQSRKEFNKYINELEKFTDRKNFTYVKNKYGVVISRDDMNEIKTHIKKINKQKRKDYRKIKNKTFKTRGQNTLEKVNDRKLMGDTRFDEFTEKTFNFDRFRDQKEIEMYKKSVNKQAKSDYVIELRKKYKSNYIIALQNVFGKMGKKLISKVKSMSLEDFLEIYYTEDIGIIDYLYEFTDVLQKLRELEIVFNV